MKMYSVLNSEEQNRLAEKWQKYGDISARDRLVYSCLRLVLSVANRYASNRDDLFDLIQEGNQGLLRAADKYNPNKGASFSTYAHEWIFSKVFKHRLNLGRIVPLPRHQIDTLTRIFRIRDYHFQNYGT